MTRPEHPAPGLAAHCHAMLLRFAGRLPDALIAETRDRLVAGDLESLARAIAAAILVHGVQVSADDAGLLGELLVGTGIDSAPLGPLTADPAAAEPLPAWTFAPAGPSVLRAHGTRIGRCLDLTDDRNEDIMAGMIDEADAAVIGVAEVDGSGVAGLWRAWRFAPEGSAGVPPRRVYLAEVSAATDPSLLALRGQIALSAEGEPDPQVEVYHAATALPAYQRTARAWSALLWTTAPPRSFRRAAVYDAVDPAAGPCFDGDHPQVSDVALRERVLTYLDSGAMIRAAAQLRDDVVDPQRRGAVPWNFRTDGAWIWSDAIAYYLRVHALMPEPEFLRHVTGGPAYPPRLDSVTAFRAMAELYRGDGSLND